MIEHAAKEDRQSHINIILEEAAMAIGARLSPAFWCKLNDRDDADHF